MPTFTRHENPQLRPIPKKGRPPSPPDQKDLNAQDPIIQAGDQSFHVKGIVEANREAAHYHQVPRLRPSFWAELGLEVRRSPIRSSAVATFRRCPRRFMFLERLGLLRRGSYAPALHVGKVMHDLLQQYYGGVAIANFQGLTLAHLNAALEQLHRDTDEMGILPNGRSYSEMAMEVERNAKLGCAMAIELARAIPREDLLRSYDILSVEQPYQVHVKGLDVPLVVKPDLLLRNRETGALWIPDHKTTSESPQLRAARLPFEFQARFYKYVVWAWFDAMRGESDKPVVIGGIMHNIIRRPTIRQTQKETFDQYIERVHRWYAEALELDPSDPPILVSTVPHVGPILDEEMLVQIHQTGLASKAFLDLGRFYADDGGCFGYGKVCPYVDLCRAAALNQLQDWERLLKEDFRQEFREDREDRDTLN